MLKRNTKNLSIALLSIVMVVFLAMGLSFTPKIVNAATTGILYVGESNASVPANFKDDASGVEINFNGSNYMDSSAREAYFDLGDNDKFSVYEMLKVTEKCKIEFIVPQNVTLEIKYIIGYSSSTPRYYGFFDQAVRPSSSNGTSTGSIHAKKESGSNASFYWDEKEHTEVIEGGENGCTKYMCFSSSCHFARIKYSITIENPNQWVITYDTQGGTKVNSQYVDKTAETAQLSNAVPTKEGYRFMGWATTQGGNVEYSANETIAISDNITLYAVWEKEYTISFVTNTAKNIDSQTLIKGETVVLPTITKDYAELLGWATTQGGSVEYAVGGKFIVGEADVTFYAVWNQSKYTVTFDGTNETVTVDKNSAIGNLPIEPAAPEGMEFGGWYTEVGGNGTEVTESFKPTADITVYPKWNAKTYYITAELNGYEVGGVPTSAEYGTTVTLPQSIGEQFIKWSVDGTEIFGYTFTMPAKDVTVELVELINAPANDPTIEDVTVTFKDMSENILGSITVDKGSKIDAYEYTYAQVPKNSLRFGGWYLDNKKDTHGNKFDFDEDLVQENLILYALWIDPVDTESFKKYIDYIINTTQMPNSGHAPLWATEGFKYTFNYIDGVFFNGLVTLYYQETDATKKEGYKNFFLNYINYFVDDDGNILQKSGSSFVKVSLSGKKELDFICEAKILFDAYELSGKEKYIKAIENYYVHLTTNMGTVTGSYDNYEHKSKYENQIWLDGMYMYAPYNARYLSATNADPLKFYALRRQFEFIYEKMKAENGLYYHAYSPNTSLSWVNETNHCSTNFWSRSIGWLSMGLVDSIEYFPEGNDKDFLKKMLNELMDSLISFKDKDTDMFYQLVNYDTFVEGFTEQNPNGRNYLETSGSSMIAYALMKGARLGYLNKGAYDYRQEGKETFEGVYNHSLEYKGDNEYHLYDICKMAGLGGDKDGSIRYYLTGESVVADDGKGLGPFILAFIEYANESPTAPKTPDIRQKTVTFMNGESEVATVKTYVNKTVSSIAAPSESGKTFSHWSTYPNGEAYDFNTPIEDDLTLYAVWEGEQFVFTKSFSKGDTFTTPSKLDGYTFVGWTNDNGANIYGSGQQVLDSGEYFALYGRTTFLGGSIRKNDPTGVRFGFEVEFANVTSSEILTNIVANMRAEFEIEISGKVTKVPAQRCFFENGKIIMNIVIIDGGADLTGKCEIPITASLYVTIADSVIAPIEGENRTRTIKYIAEQAYKNNDITAEMAKKYGYGA